MSEVTIIFPHQLFKQNPALDRQRTVYLVEEYLFFRQYKFHKQKLILHRASMKRYQAYLENLKFQVVYVDINNKISGIVHLVKELKKKRITAIFYTNTVDNWLEKRITKTCSQTGIVYYQLPTPNFLNQTEDLNEYFSKKKRYFQTDFYIAQRKERNLLLDSNKNPLGGKWTFDIENRLKFPKKEVIPTLKFPDKNKYVEEAIAYVEKYFPDNYGDSSGFCYPVSFEDAEAWLSDFLQTRFEKFGIYEDAMVKDENFLYHSVLSPLLNIGLLSPLQIINAALEFKNKIPLNSLEGFIRQITGWREFIRIVYDREGTFQRTNNFWKFSRKIPSSFWTANTGIHPVDTVIKRLLNTGYSHHIERLMVLGNFMLLCEFDPDEVYKWFMEMYIDSYDWVMVPNVYGMTQFADGGLMTTKPYISGSNYLLKMGNWEKGEWQEIWDGLFWRFMHVHREFLLQNPRLTMLIRTYDKMPEEKRQKHLSVSESFLKQLDK